MRTPRTNKNFNHALAYTRANHAELFHEPITIRLVAPDGRAHGRFWSFTVRRDPATGMLSKIMEPTITIANGRRSVGDFVNTLVHELTHHQQHLAGRPYCEMEAHSAGNRAEGLFNQ